MHKMRLSSAQCGIFSDHGNSAWLFPNGALFTDEDFSCMLQALIKDGYRFAVHEDLARTKWAVLTRFRVQAFALYASRVRSQHDVLLVWNSVKHFFSDHLIFHPDNSSTAKRDMMGSPDLSLRVSLMKSPTSVVGNSYRQAATFDSRMTQASFSAFKINPSNCFAASTRLSNSFSLGGVFSPCADEFSELPMHLYRGLLRLESQHRAFGRNDHLSNRFIDAFVAGLCLLVGKERLNRVGLTQHLIGRSPMPQNCKHLKSSSFSSDTFWGREALVARSEKIRLAAKACFGPVPPPVEELRVVWPPAVQDLELFLVKWIISAHTKGVSSSSFLSTSSMNSSSLSWKLRAKVLIVTAEIQNDPAVLMLLQERYGYLLLELTGKASLTMCTPPDELIIRDHENNFVNVVDENRVPKKKVRIFLLVGEEKAGADETDEQNAHSKDPRLRVEIVPTPVSDTFPRQALICVARSQMPLTSQQYQQCLQHVLLLPFQHLKAINLDHDGGELAHMQGSAKYSGTPQQIRLPSIFIPRITFFI